MNIKQIKFKLLILTLPVICLLTTPVLSKIVDKTLATINGETILLSEFKSNWQAYFDQQRQTLPPEQMDSKWKRDSKQQLLDLMIEQKLLLKEAKRRKLTINKRDLEKGIETIKGRFRVDEHDRPVSEKETEKAFKEELLKEGLTKKEFEERIRDQLLTMQLREQEIFRQTDPPKEENIKILYDRLMKKLGGKNIPGLSQEEEDTLEAMAQFFKAKTGERISARHILIRIDPTDSFKKKSAAKVKIQKIKKKLDNGADFEETARQYSEDPGSAEQGGALGELVRGQMVKPFEDAAFKLPVGAVSNVVETEFGYHIIKIEGKMAAQKIRYETVKPDLEQHLFQKEAQKRYEEWIKKLRKRSIIKVEADFYEDPEARN